MTGPGPLALIGGAEWRQGCQFDTELLEAAGGKEVLVLPTAAAYEHPQRSVDSATTWFERMGAEVRPLMVLSRPDAEDAANAAVVADARFIYLGGGSPLHLRSVLKDSAVWAALVAAWRNGAVVAGSSAGAMVLTDPMVDPRGGAYTVGLGLVSQLAVIPHADTWSPEKAHRTVTLATKGIPVVALDEQTAIIRHLSSEKGWVARGAGAVKVFLNGQESTLDSLPA
ncbi:MAG TPA: Type 1 glutamine amidotransferase-like domain-containing protein [Acidimicrobiales bacterium]|nr:Type 1 glutamine amidotransferase-like domain-containing protein [Acidimicrobiales bacterium]